MGKSFFDRVRGNSPSLDEVEKPIEKKSIFSTHGVNIKKTTHEIKEIIKKNYFQIVPFAVATDSADKVQVATVDAANQQLKNAYKLGVNGGVPDALLDWFSAGGFIGYQMAAILATKSKLINKICLMPAQDAVRNGYEITNNDGEKVDPKIFEQMRKLDDDFKINEKLIDYLYKGNIFGIRLCLFLVDSDDPQYYFKPFNIDSATKNSYKGLTLIDPYWTAPELDIAASSRPDAQDFYEPTYWVIGGKKIHRTHFCIFRTTEVPDILKPSYIYGGIPIPEQVYERVYAADRTANEAPQLAMTKRVTTLNIDMMGLAAQELTTTDAIEQFVATRDNYGVYALGESDKLTQFDISLADLDATIMTQYQLCAMLGEVPATKLLGTTPKGFNATGEYDAKSYHERLQGLQKNFLTPVINRHHELLIK